MENIYLNTRGKGICISIYLNEVFPREKPKKGELLDRFTKRPYTPDPIDIDYGKNLQ